MASQKDYARIDPRNIQDQMTKVTQLEAAQQVTVESLKLRSVSLICTCVL